jgi:hypothetical protein
VGVNVKVEVGRGVLVGFNVEVGTGVFDGVAVEVLVNEAVTVGVKLGI